MATALAATAKRLSGTSTDIQKYTFFIGLIELSSDI
jgi:hypothetical protein